MHFVEVPIHLCPNRWSSTERKMVFLRLCRIYSKNAEKVDGEDKRARARIADKFACGSGAEEVRRNMAKALATMKERVVRLGSTMDSMGQTRGIKFRQPS